MNVIAAIYTVVSGVNLFSGFSTVTVTDRKINNISLIMISFRTIVVLTTLFSKHKILSGFQSFRPKPFTLLSSTQYFEHLKSVINLGEVQRSRRNICTLACFKYF